MKNRKVILCLLSIAVISGIIIIFISKYKQTPILDTDLPVENIIPTDKPLHDSNDINITPTTNSETPMKSETPNVNLNSNEPQETMTLDEPADKYIDENNPPKTLEDAKKITRGMTREEVETMLGLPNTIYGSGTSSPAYCFEDGRFLVIAYNENGVSSMGIVSDPNPFSAASAKSEYEILIEYE